MHPFRPRGEQTFLTSLCAIFFLSGASALVYQVLWLRLLGLIFGVTVYAASTVWASFMAGLALGSFVAGRLADRVARPLRWFAVIEGLIAITGVSTTFAFAVVVRSYPQLAPTLDAGLARATALRFALTFAILIVPTALMGATLPLVVKSAVGRGRRLGASMGVLYGSNTAGAIAGTLVAGLWFIPGFGMRVTFAVAAGLNLLAAIAAWLMSTHTLTAADAGADAAASPYSADAVSAWERRIVLATFTLSGAVALALEVVWLRSAIIIAGPTVYTVSLLLATILAGIALGSYTITPWLSRLRRPLAWLGGIEAAIAFSILWSLVSLATLPSVMNAVPNAITAIVPAYLLPVVVSAVLVAFPTSWLMGLAFPLGVQLWTSSAVNRERSSDLGLFYALNVCGGIAGSLGAGFLLLPTLGSGTSISALAAATLASAVVLLVVSASTWVTRVLPAALVAVFLILAGRAGDPTATLLALRLPGQPEIWREEGVQTTASIHTFAFGRRRALHLDGYHQAADDGSSLLLHYQIGTLPLALHANPVDSLVVGLGGGATAGALSRYSRVGVDVIELSDTVVRASEFFRHINFDLLTRPNVHLRLDDGRNFLLAHRRHYDIITADTIQPVRAGSASLYSREYFTLVRDRLNDNGVAVQWFAGTEAEYKLVARTFASVFPYVTVWNGGALLVGTKRPLQLSPADFNWKLQVPELKNAFASIGIDSFEDLIALFWAGPDDLRRYVGDGPLLTDDRPILEFFLSLPRDKDPDFSALKGDVAQVLAK